MVTHTIRRSMMRRTKLWVAALVVLLATAVAVGAASLGGASTRPAYGKWAPGVAADVGAMKRLPPEAHPSEPLAEQVRHAASATGGSPEAALQSLRKLRSGLGVSQATLYAFSPGENAACFVVWRWTIVCPTADASRTPGIEAVLNGGYPAGANGSAVAVPSAIAGLVADNVEAVVLVNIGDRIPLTIKNNAFFYVPAEPVAGAPWTMELHVTYRDGHTATTSVPDPRP